MSFKYWTVPPIWKDETIAILAGGPSLQKYHVEICKSNKYKIIAINNSYLLDSTADIVYFCDLRWWQWHCDNQKFIEHPGIKVTLENIDLAYKKQYKSLKNMGRDEFNFTLNSNGIGNGANSGYQALNLAVLLGSKHIILLGYDMGETTKSHWHSGHPVKTPLSVYNSLMIPSFNKIAPELKNRNISVFNANRQSLLRCFDFIDL